MNFVNVVTMPAAYYAAPIIALVGLFCFAYPKRFIEIQESFIHSKEQMFWGGIVGLAVGLSMLDAVSLSWWNWPNVLVNFFGYLLMIKSSLFLCLPCLVERIYDKYADQTYPSLIPIIGAFYLVLGFGMQFHILFSN